MLKRLKERIIRSFIRGQRESNNFETSRLRQPPVKIAGLHKFVNWKLNCLFQTIIASIVAHSAGAGFCRPSHPGELWKDFVSTTTAMERCRSVLPAFIEWLKWWYSPYRPLAKPAWRYSWLSVVAFFLRMIYYYLLPMRYQQYSQAPLCITLPTYILAGC